MSEIQEITGTLTPGYGWAGIGLYGPNAKEKRHIAWGTILLQSPHFVSQGLDFDTYFDRCLRPGNWRPGTMNISVAPLSIVELKPDYVMRDVTWFISASGNKATETFLLTELMLEYRGREYKGLHYYVDPSTKTGSPQPKTMIEVVAEPIFDIEYGDQITIKIDADKIILAQPGIRDILKLSGKAASRQPNP